MQKNEDTTGILDKAYPEVENALKKNLSSYKRYMSAFINNRAEQFYTNIPSQQIYFTQKDSDEFFRTTRINKAKIKEGIQSTYYSSLGAFNPSYAKDDTTIAMVCVVRYFKLHKMPKELELSLINISFSGKYYPSIFYSSYQKFYPQDYIMEYVINNMCSQKFDIVKEGSVLGAVKSIASTWIDTYSDRFEDFHDDDAVYLVQQLHNRIASFVHNIAELYYDAYKNKDKYITYDSDDVGENNYRLATNDAFKLEKIVSNAMTTLDSKGINTRICKMASNNDVKFDELKSILETLIGDNNNIGIIKEFLTLLVVCYFKQTKKRDVTDLDFISFSITARPNSKDEYTIRQKELLQNMLINNSEHFARRRNRAATESAYYRAINAYFALIIQESNK